MQVIRSPIHDAAAPGAAGREPAFDVRHPQADAAPTRRSSRRPSAPLAAEAPGALTRAEARRRAAAAQAAPSSVDAPSADAAIGVEQVAPFGAEISVAEAVVADVAAAMTVGTGTDAASRRRLREATEAVAFAHVAESEAATPERAAEPAPEASTSAS